MHLHYSGNQNFTNKAVNKANRILVSSFYQKEIEKELYFVDSTVLIDKMKSNDSEAIPVISKWHLFQSKKDFSSIQPTKISINLRHIKKSKQVFVVKLLKDYTCIQLQLFDTTQEKDRERIGVIIDKLVKSYI